MIYRPISTLRRCRRSGFKSSRPAAIASSVPRAFTVVELLVCISILGILLSLVLSGIGAAREAARRIACLNHLRQIGLACANYHATHGTFPPTECGTLDPPGVVRSVSPQMRLLPFLDQNELFLSIDIGATGGAVDDLARIRRNDRALNTAVAEFMCPSDDVKPGGSSYRACMGIGPEIHGRGEGLGGFERGNGSGAFVNWYATSASHFRDGLSRTVLFSEKVVGDGDDLHFMPAGDILHGRTSISTIAEAEAACLLVAGPVPAHNSQGGASWLFAGYQNTWYNHIFTPNSRRPDCSEHLTVAGGAAITARSWHMGGVNAVFGDGAARFVSQQVDLQVWRALSTRAHAEPVSDAW